LCGQNNIYTFVGNRCCIRFSIKLYIRNSQYSLTCLFVWTK